MSKKTKQWYLTMLVGMFTLFLLTMPSFAYIWGNYSECSYTGSNNGGLESTGLSHQVMVAASNFLESHARYQAFLAAYETSGLTGVDYQSLRLAFLDARESLELAAATMADLKTAAENTPYNPAMIEMLKDFNYNGYQTEHQVLEPIFKQVAKKGDVRSVYAQMSADLYGLLDQFYPIQDKLRQNLLPGVNSLWRLNQAYFQAQLYGQYTAEVFSAILGDFEDTCPN